MLPQLEQGLVGASAGEKRSVTVNFPADYRAADLAGKEAVFATETKKVEEPALPELDEEFYKAFGLSEGGIPNLREDVAADIRRELAANLRGRNKNVVMDKLFASNPLDISNVFEPLDLMARLAALVPTPRMHLTRYHGVGFIGPHCNVQCARCAVFEPALTQCPTGIVGFASSNL